MKRLFLFTMILILNLVSIYGQSEWTADLRVDAEYVFPNPIDPEVNVSMYADLYYNDELKPVLPTYKYEFFKRYILLPDPVWIQFITTPQWGDNHQGTHTYLDSTIVPEGKFEVYCKITLPDETIVNSDIITIPWYSVSPDQKNFSGSSFGSIDYWYKGSFKDNNGLNEIYIPRYDPKVLQANINVVSNPQEKFQFWDDNIENTYYNNFVHYYLDGLLNTNLQSNFYYITNATIRAKVDNYYLDVIKFKDPWLRDYDEQPFGIRNQGLGAIPQPLVNDENNLGISTNHQGVLLNQDPVQSPAYYSIDIPSSIYLTQTGQTHNIYLQSWDLSGASLENENSLETGVVFTNSSGATITANVKATQLSDNQNAFINNSQRKFIRTPDLTNTLHMVYESMGHVYYETSIDNGQSWILMKSYLLQLTTLDK